MIRRFVLLLTVGALMAALLVVTASPASADHRDDRDRIIIFSDRDRDRDFVFDRFDRFGRFGGFGQSFDQEATSGDVDISYRATNTGNNSNVTAPALQFANTGNVQNQQGFSSFGTDDRFFRDGDRFFRDGDRFFFRPSDRFFGRGGDVEFEGASMEFSPSLTTNSTQTVQQSSAAATSGWGW